MAIITGCSTSSQQKPILSYTYTPPIVINLRSIYANGNYHIAEFEMRNVSKNDMWFTGYERDQYGHNQPDFMVQHQLSIGGWNWPQEGEVVCGMGLGRCCVPAGASTTFLYSFWPKSDHPRPFRIGVRLCEYEYPARSIRDIVY